MWQELASVLNALNKAYEALVRLGEKKQNALAALDMKGLEAILGEEKKLTASVESLEARRKKALLQLAATQDKLTPEASMKDVIRLAPNSLSRVLSQLHAALTKHTERAKELSDNNRFLAEGALGAVTYHLNRLSGAAATGSYGSSGGETVDHARGFEFKA